jgi:hypothetical protein
MKLRTPCLEVKLHQMRFIFRPNLGSAVKIYQTEYGTFWLTFQQRHKGNRCP